MTEKNQVFVFPDRPNFFSSLHTSLPKDHVADLYLALGWEVSRCTWTDYEVLGPWADLVIEAESPILMHGLVADVSVHVEELVAPLRAAGVSFSAECYDEEGTLIRELAG